jgi:hypothetical protein
LEPVAEYMKLVNVLMGQGRKDEAVTVLKHQLDADPHDWKAILGLAEIEYMNANAAWSSHIYARAQQIAGARGATEIEMSVIVNGIGRGLDDLGDIEEAHACFAQALKLNPDDQKCLNNVGLTLFKLGHIELAIETLEKAHEMEPEHLPARLNLAMAYLKHQDWAKGWPMWRSSLGAPDRPVRADLNMPTWVETLPPAPRAAPIPGEIHIEVGGTNVTIEDESLTVGSDDFDPFEGSDVSYNFGRKRTVVYGEQGIGDELLFASCMQDMIDAEGPDFAPVMETQPRLEGLFRRSFPDAHVYGTKGSAPIWMDDLKDVGQKIALGNLPTEFRADGNFPGTPYLIPCPHRAAGAKAMLRALDKGKKTKKIGIAWHGGTMTTDSMGRSLELKEMMAAFEGVKGVTFISLQYRDSTVEAAPYGNVHAFPWLTCTRDYDDVAALVSQLDAVVSVATSVVNLAGGLGVPTWILTPDRAPWRYPDGVTHHPWFAKSKLVRKVDGVWPMRDALEEALNGTGKLQRSTNGDGKRARPRRSNGKNTGLDRAVRSSDQPGSHPS